MNQEFLITIPSDVPNWQPKPEIAIQNTEDYANVAERLNLNKAFQKQVVEFFRPLKQQADQAHKVICDAERKILTPAQDDERRDKSLMVTYSTEQERLRREAEDKARAAALKAEEDRRLAEAAALDELARATGDAAYAAEAEAIIQAPVEAPAVTVKSTMPAVAGVSYRETWSAVVVDKKRLVAFVAANPDYLNLLDVNQSAVNALARALKSTMKIPGLQPQAAKTVASRAS